MNCCRQLVGIVLMAAVGLLVGCGRPTLPGRQFRAERFQPDGAETDRGPLPDNPYREWGAQDAKVRIEAYYPINESHKALMALLEDLTKEYPGKVHVKYIDYRTQEGAQLLSQTGLVGSGLLVNGRSRLEIQAEPRPYEAEFVLEMGRLWIADDLKAAVAQEVAAAYGQVSSAR